MRFPVRAAGEVRKALKTLLERRSCSFGISSATVGGDTIFIDELLERGGSARVLLPCPLKDFLEHFVGQPDRRYEVRSLLTHRRAEVIVADDPTDPADVWADFGPRLRDHAKAWADLLDEQPLLIALSDGEPSFLQSVIERWEERNWEVEPLRLRDGRLVP